MTDRPTSPGKRLRRGQRLIDAAIEAGPPCVCGHKRADHRGTFSLPNHDGTSNPTEYGFFDGPCQIAGCTACPSSGYAFPDGRPYEAPDMVLYD